MQTFNQALASLIMRRVITRDMGLATSSLPDELSEMLDRGVGLPQAAAGSAPPPSAAGQAARRQ
jgi:hypothetical protein